MQTIKVNHKKAKKVLETYFKNNKQFEGTVRLEGEKLIVKTIPDAVEYISRTIRLEFAGRRFTGRSIGETLEVANYTLNFEVTS